MYPISTRDLNIYLWMGEAARRRLSGVSSRRPMNSEPKIEKRPTSADARAWSRSWSIVAALWMTAVLAVFAVIRVLQSQSAQVLSHWWRAR